MTYDDPYAEPELNTAVLNDSAAELAVLAAVLTEPACAPQFAAIPNEVFYRPAHQMLHLVICDIVRDGAPLDAMVVHQAIGRRVKTSHHVKQLQTLVVDLIGRGNSVALGFYTDRLVSLAQARAAHQAAERLAQRIEEAARLDDSELVASSIAAARSSLESLGGSISAGPDDMPMSLDALLATYEGAEVHDWLVPGLFEKTERMILTSFEGIGKSFLLAQMACTIAAGLHPFLGHPIGSGASVLVIDAENSHRQTARRYRRIRGMVNGLCDRNGHGRPDWNECVRFDIRPEGVELNDPRVLRRIEREIVAASPDLVIMGPLYRLHKLDTRDEQAAKELTDAIDALRVKHNFTVLAEAHVAHGGGGRDLRALRPTGSSLFLRWPEFGIGLRPTRDAAEMEHPNEVDVVAWRGGREDRVWPTTLSHNFRDLPWMADSHYATRLAREGFM